MINCVLKFYGQSSSNLSLFFVFSRADFQILCSYLWIFMNCLKAQRFLWKFNFKESCSLKFLWNVIVVKNFTRRCRVYFLFLFLFLIIYIYIYICCKTAPHELRYEIFALCLVLKLQIASFSHEISGLNGLLPLNFSPKRERRRRRYNYWWYWLVGRYF